MGDFRRVVCAVAVFAAIVAMTPLARGATPGPDEVATDPCRGATIASGFVFSIPSEQKLSFGIGEPIVVTMAVKNIGPDVHGTYSPYRETLRVRVIDEAGQRVPPAANPLTGFGSIAGGPMYIPAGNAREIRVPLDKLVPGVAQPGSYIISAKLLIASRPPVGCVETKPVMITVVGPP